MSEQLQLKAKIVIDGEIEAITGLHIGGSSTEISIGGADLVVVRNPYNNQPYIPGSSLKGKMRCLLEKAHNLHLREVAKVRMHQCEKEKKPCWLCRIFGLPGEHPYSSPTRLYVRDGELLNADELEELPGADMPFTEVKTEVAIDRITSAANPRNIERVPAGAKFSLSLIFNMYKLCRDGSVEEDTLEDLDRVLEGLRLIEDDYLGGHGSRGYGQVKFNVQKITIKKAEYYRGEEEEITKELAEGALPDSFSELLKPHFQEEQ